MSVIKRYQSAIYGNYKKKLLIYGLLAGLALIAVVVLRFAMILPILYPVSIIDNIILLGLMFSFTYLYRKDNIENKLTFKETYLLNFGIGIVAAIFYAAFLWLYASFIDTEFPSRFIEHQIEVFQKLELTEIELAQKVSSLEKESLPGNLAFRAFAEISIISILFAMIVGIIMRTEKAPVREKKKK